MMKLRIFVAIIAFMMMVSQSLQAKELYDLWMKQKLPDALRTLANNQEGVETVSVHKCKDTVGGKTVEYERHSRFRAYDRWRFSETFVRNIKPADGEPFVATNGFGTNSQYSFMIERNSKDKYIVTSIIPQGETLPRNELSRYNSLQKASTVAMDLPGKMSFMGLEGYHQPQELDQLPGFTLVSAEERNGGQEFAIVFRVVAQTK